MRTAILHIGTEKTGTTTLQHFLERNRARLEADGFAYPLSAGAHDCHKLVLHALDLDRCEDGALPFGLADKAAGRAMQAAFETAFAQEMRSLAPRARTVLLSSEHYHSCLFESAELERVAALLARYVDRVEVLVYLRRQDRVAISRRSTLLKSGQVAGPVLPPTDERNGYYNYAALLDRWSAVFGEEQMRPRLFEPASFTGGSLVADFCAACGIEDVDRLSVPKSLNESLTPEAQAFLEAINPYFPPYVDGRANPERRALIRFVEDAFAGAGCLPTRADAIRFQARFERSNEQVRARWFPHRARLFDDDFSTYPEEDPAPVAAADAIRVSAELWRRSAAELRRLEAEIAYRNGRIARLRGRHADAESCFNKALTLDPNHPKAHLQLERVPKAGIGRRPRLGGLLKHLRLLARASVPWLAR